MEPLRLRDADSRFEEPRSPGTPVTVLVVDDEAAARDLCSDVAAEVGLRARTAATTGQALEILEQWPVDIVITDLKVTEIYGL